MYNNPLVPPPEVPASVPKPYARQDLKTEAFNKSCSHSLRSPPVKDHPIIIDLTDESPENYGLAYKDLYMQYPIFPLFRQNLSASVHGLNPFSPYD